MKGMLYVAAAILLTVVCWGVYGPTLHEGQHRMGADVEGRHVPSLYRPFICVGLAYFAIAVIVPTILLHTRGEAGRWTFSGIVWSLAAGAAGAMGALGIIMAFKNNGNPLYVMPLVFGCAPVVNTFTTMAMNRSYRQTGPLFFAGLILVIAGAVAVLVFKPPPAVAAGAVRQTATAGEFAMSLVWVAVAALSWGMYGPVLHKGQANMAGSKLRPFICVGIAYFLIAVLIPSAILAQAGEPGSWSNVGGTVWSLAGGAAGAMGALGIIFAFNFGGKPIYVMPLVFGGAPVVNTLVTMVAAGVAETPHPLFFAGLIVVAAGAVTVLVFAPRSHAPAT